MELLSRNEFWLIIILICCIVSIVLFYLISRWWRRLSLRRRFRHGIKAEAYLERILRSRGYQVLGVQKPITMTAFVDNEKIDYKVRPDAVASKGGKEYFVEVKTGKRSVDPMYRHTRRQLLEYYYGSPGDGVLLVDGDSGSVHTVRFQESLVRDIQEKSYFFKVLAAFFLGALGSAVFFLLW